MLDRHADNIAIFIYVYIDVFAYLFRLTDSFVCEFHMSGVCIGKVFHFHSLLLLVRPVDEGIMNRRSVFEQNNPQIFPSLRYLGPFSDPTVGLSFRSRGIFNDELCPILLYRTNPLSDDG